MTHKLPALILMLGLAAVLWVMPSVGTQGMGTIGARFTHPDRGLIADPHAADRAGDGERRILQHADAAVEVALGF